MADHLEKEETGKTAKWLYRVEKVAYLWGPGGLWLSSGLWAVEQSRSFHFTSRKTQSRIGWADLGVIYFQATQGSWNQHPHRGDISRMELLSSVQLAILIFRLQRVRQSFLQRKWNANKYIADRRLGSRQLYLLSDVLASSPGLDIVISKSPKVIEA